jgi:ubiquinone/menaquinone biosynthesis C-methylase UbiE
MTDTPHPSPDLFLETANAYQQTAALAAAVELDLFTAIDAGASTTAEIAARCAASERGIRILCDYLTVLGFLVKTNGAYRLTRDSAAFLSKRSPGYMAGVLEFLHAPNLRGNFAHLADTVRRGTVTPDANTVADDNPVWQRFARAMMPMMTPAAQAIAGLVGATDGPMRVLDIAAGHGLFGILVARRNPAAQVVAVDWPAVLAVASANAAAMGVGARHRALAGSAFTVDWGTGFDVALVTNFLHHFDLPTNTALLRKVARSLAPGGRVVVLEFVPNDDRVTPPAAARFAINMLAGTPAGDAYTFGELRDMLAAAGFRAISRHPLQGPHTVVLGSI